MNHKNQFTQFKARFAAIAEKHGGVYNEKDTIAEGAAYRIPTPWGTLRASIHYDDWRNRRASRYIECIYLQFQDYQGPQPFPLHGDFNRFSHKWNILCGAEKLETARDACLMEFEWRLELLAEKGMVVA